MTWKRERRGESDTVRLELGFVYLFCSGGGAIFANLDNSATTQVKL